MEKLDQQIAPARRGAQQALHLLQRSSVDLPALGPLAFPFPAGTLHCNRNHRLIHLAKWRLLTSGYHA
jgi:hypothetical protein